MGNAYRIVSYRLTAILVGVVDHSLGHNHVLSFWKTDKINVTYDSQKRGGGGIVLSLLLELAAEIS